MLARFGHIEDIPLDAAAWTDLRVRGAEKLIATLRENMEHALLFRDIATVVTEIDVGTVDEWCWTGPTPAFEQMAAYLHAGHLFERATRMAAALR